MTCDDNPWSLRSALIRFNEILFHCVIQNCVLFLCGGIVNHPVGVEIYEMSISKIITVKVIVGCDGIKFYLLGGPKILSNHREKSIIAGVMVPRSDH